MKYLYPQFLYALATLAIPIIIHLFNFRKFKTVYFSNVRFLKQVKQQTKAHSQLKHLLILLSRMLALTALVLAFSQPYLPEDNTRLAQSHAVSVFVDNSFSMDAENESGRLLEIAKEQTLTVVESYPNTADFQLITQDLSGAQQRLLNKDAFLQSLNTVESTANSRTLKQLIKRQQQALQASTCEQKSLFLISDFQKELNELEKWNVDSKLVIKLLPITPHAISNLYIDSCWLNTPNLQLQQNTTLYVRLINEGKTSRKGVSVQLHINGQQKAVSSTDIDSESIIELNFTNDEYGWKNATVSIQDYPITFDDSFYLSFNVKKVLPTFSIYENEAQPSLEKLFGSDPYFSFQKQSIKQLQHSDLLQQQLVILDGVKNLSSGLTQTLNSFVKSGGSLAIFPSKEINLESYQNLLQSLETDILKELKEETIKLNKIHHKHPLFEGVFETIDEQLDFPNISSFFELTQYSQTNALPILTLENGQALINEYKYGKGIVYLSAIGLDQEFSNLSQHALAVPLLYRMALQSGNQAQLYHIVGTEHIPFQTTNGQTPYHIKNSTIDFIPNAQNNKLWIYDQLLEAGHYELTQGETNAAWLAFNYSRKESRTQTLSIKELEDFAEKHENTEVIKEEGKALSHVLSTLHKGTPLWKLCLIFALGFLALEILIIKRL